MNVRDLGPGDIPAVTALLAQLGYELAERVVRERLACVNTDPAHRARVAEVDGKVVGLLHVFERPALEKPCEAVIQALVVDAGLRGGGVGASLMRDAESWARARGLPSVSLYTGIAREPAHAFYERLGYRRAGTSHLMRRCL